MIGPGLERSRRGEPTTLPSHVLPRLLLNPLRDFIAALNASMPIVTWQRVLVAVAAAVAGWWLYVPAHELLHAFGCLATGGSVDRLEISPEYGAALLARIFPWVAVGSDYAGQLVGFDTGGSDLVYLATVYAPYLLTIFVGVPLLRYVACARRRPVVRSMLFGLSVPVAYASFANLAGDMYEIGSIPASRLGAAISTGGELSRWRSDDFLQLIGSLVEGGISFTDGVVVASGFALGFLCAFATYWAGGAFDRLIAGSRD
jgi:hypothetical protein